MIKCLWILLGCFQRIYGCRKNFARLHQFIFSNDYQEHDKKTNNYFRDKYGKRVKRKP